MMVVGNRIQSTLRGTARIAERGECEMIMMIGLPGSGKTTWVNDQVEKNPEKRYNVIGTSALIERMKVRMYSDFETFPVAVDMHGGLNWRGSLT